MELASWTIHDTNFVVCVYILYDFTTNKTSSSLLTDAIEIPPSHWTQQPAVSRNNQAVIPSFHDSRMDICVHGLAAWTCFNKLLCKCIYLLLLFLNSFEFKNKTISISKKEGKSAGLCLRL